MCASVVAMCGAGCANRPATSQERADSFAPYLETKINGERAANFLVRRTALVLGGISPAATGDLLTSGQSSKVTFSPNSFSVGSATAIDARGYFITAAHVLTTEPLLIFWVEGMKMRSATPRVVWRGEAARKEPDLAILKVPAPLEAAFSWSQTLPVGDRVLGAGPNYDEPGQYEIAYIAGRIVEVIPHPESTPSRITVLHSAPGHGGDSGGPITNTEGALIAVSIGDASKTFFPFWRSEKRGRAFRPDLVWLQRLIDADAALNP